LGLGGVPEIRKSVVPSIRRLQFSPSVGEEQSTAVGTLIGLEPHVETAFLIGDDLGTADRSHMS
jgi:hypothetical protein